MRLPRGYIGVKRRMGAFPSCYPGRCRSDQGLHPGPTHRLPRPAQRKRTERTTPSGTPDSAATASLVLSAAWRGSAVQVMTAPAETRAGDFAEFVTARSARLLRVAYLLTRDWALAEDLLQTSLAKAWTAWRRIEGDPEPYVRRILVNTYTSWWRRRWHHERPTNELPERPGPRSADSRRGRPRTRYRRWRGGGACCASAATAPL